jgi:L-asparaginase / beta-aspartyl-peptidase
MKTILGVLLAAALASGPLASKARPAGETAIRAVLEAQVAAWNKGDIDGFMNGYWNSPATTFAGSSGVKRGWGAVLERYRRDYPDRQMMGRLEFSNLEITMLSSDAALVLGYWQLERTHDRPGGVFTLVFRRFSEGWRIVPDHTSVVRSP